MNELDSAADQSKIGQETRELVEVYSKILWLMYRNEFALEYEKMEEFNKSSDKMEQQNIKSSFGYLYSIAINKFINIIVRLSVHLHIKQTFKKIRLLNSLESVSLLASSKWNTQDIQNSQNDLINTFYKKLNDEMQYIEDSLPNFKDYLNNFLGSL